MLQLRITSSKVLRVIHSCYHRCILISPFDYKLILAEAYDNFKFLFIGRPFALSGYDIQVSRRYLIFLVLICVLIDAEYAPGLTLQEVRTKMPPTDVMMAFRGVLCTTTEYFECIIIIDGAIGSDTFAALGR